MHRKQRQRQQNDGRLDIRMAKDVVAVFKYLSEVIEVREFYRSRARTICDGRRGGGCRLVEPADTNCQHLFVLEKDQPMSFVYDSLSTDVIREHFNI